MRRFATPHHFCSTSSFLVGRVLPMMNTTTTTTTSHHHQQQVRAHTHGAAGHTGKPIKMKWRGGKIVGGEKDVIAHVGQTLLEVSRDHDIPLEGACEASCACSTCHVIFEEKVYASLPEGTEAEEDMLDLAFDLRPTSRLGCQVKVTEEMDGTTVELPAATRNMAVDGYVATPH
eukprot:PhM_4_TR9211/c0_g1_i1/m.105995/K22071/FDX2; ferredoxin-2, mitochondrial